MGCPRQGGAPALIVTFRRPARVDRLSISAGLAEANDQRTRQARPRAIDVVFSDGTCVSADLTDTAGAQSVAVNIAETTTARLVIVDVFAARDIERGVRDVMVSLSEVTFQTRDGRLPDLGR
jgi:hypothetical protein